MKGRPDEIVALVRGHQVKVWWNDQAGTFKAEIGYTDGSDFPAVFDLEEWLDFTETVENLFYAAGVDRPDL